MMKYSFVAKSAVPCDWLSCRKSGLPAMWCRFLHFNRLTDSFTKFRKRYSILWIFLLPDLSAGRSVDSEASSVTWQLTLTNRTQVIACSKRVNQDTLRMLLYRIPMSHRLPDTTIDPGGIEFKSSIFNILWLISVNWISTNLRDSKA